MVAPFRCGFAAIAGRPNVGKSTLFNALVSGKRSIVSRRRQTTRNCIRGVFDDGARQIVFIDTPGWQGKDAAGRMNALMDRSVAQTAPRADVVLFLTEPRPPSAADHDVVKLVPADVPILVAINKIDRIRRKNDLLPLISEISQMRDFTAIIPISATKKKGLDTLVDGLANLMPESPRMFEPSGESAQDDSFFISEVIREKLFRRLGAELPYATAVQVLRVRHQPKLLDIDADILVDTESRKAIVIGAGGEMLKSVATSARLDLQRHFNIKVMLRTRVKVNSSWRRDENFLARLGIGDSV